VQTRANAHRHTFYWSVEQAAAWSEASAADRAAHALVHGGGRTPAGLSLAQTVNQIHTALESPRQRGPTRLAPGIVLGVNVEFRLDSECYKFMTSMVYCADDR